MALATFAELKLALADWMVGQSVSSRLDTFVAMAEAEFNRRLRVRDMLGRSTALAATPYIPLPFDFLEAKNVTVPCGGGRHRTLRQVTMFEADDRRGGSGDPGWFVVSGPEMEIVPAPPATGLFVEMVYYAKLPTLSDDQPTNWLLARWPDLYLNCALAHAQPYLANPEMAAFHRQEVERAYEEIRAQDTNAQLGATPLAVRPRRSFP